jgi:hypothetical protein
VSDLIWFFSSGGGLVMLLLAGAVWLRARPLSRHPRRFLVIVAIVYGVRTN